MSFLEKREKLVVILGPTAVGKTAMSIQLAKRFSGEIISGDSMQIYRGMDIGTAKITKEEMEGIPHHLIDIKNPDESFSAYEFQQLVRRKITEITTQNSLPMIVGGTGLYIQSVIYDYQFIDDSCDDSIRNKLYKRFEDEGIEPLFAELKKIDPQAAENIHPNNERRVIRALEIYYTTGETMTERKEKQQRELLYDVVLIGLTMDRDVLYKRINKRVDLMVEQGLVEEAKSFYDKGLRNVQSTQAIGYKELFDYFDGNITLDEAINQIKKNTRHFAKRQLTWFRNKMDVNWFDMTDANAFHENLEKISEFIAGKF